MVLFFHILFLFLFFVFLFDNNNLNNKILFLKKYFPYIISKYYKYKSYYLKWTVLKISICISKYLSLIIGLHVDSPPKSKNNLSNYIHSIFYRHFFHYIIHYFFRLLYIFFFVTISNHFFYYFTSFKRQFFIIFPSWIFFIPHIY